MMDTDNRVEVKNMPSIAGAPYAKDAAVSGRTPLYRRILHRPGRRQAILAAAFFFLALSRWFYLPAPYALCCLMAMMRAGESPWPCAAGIAASLIYQLCFGVEVPAWTLGACVLAPFVFRIRWREDFSSVLGVLALTLPGEALRIYLTDVTAQGIVLTVLGYTLAAGSIPALCKAARYLRAGAQGGTRDDCLCLVLPVLMVLCGMSRLSLWQVNIGHAAACAATLTAAFLFGSVPAAATGLMCGLAVLLGGQGSFFAIALPLSGLICGLFQGRKPLFGALMLLTVSALCCYIFAGRLHAGVLFSALCGCVIQCLLPGRTTDGIRRFVYASRLIARESGAFWHLRLRRLSAAMRRMADAVPQSEEDPECAAGTDEDWAERLCDGCEQMMTCWQTHFDATRAAFVRMAQTFAETGQTPAPPEGCIRREQMEAIAVQLLTSRQEDAQKRQRIAYETDMLRAHFRALASAVDALEDEDAQNASEEAESIQAIDEALRLMRFPGKTDYVRRTDGHWTAAVRCGQLTLLPALENQLCRTVGLRLNAPMHLTDKAEGLLVFSQTPPYKIDSGIATACAVSDERKNITPYAVENGDAVLQRPLKNGGWMAALSDGMGHGRNAGQESRKALELLSLFLETGYTRTQALTAVNGMLLTATDGDRFATVDLCTVDLWRGDCSLMKLGACASYLIQGQFVRAIGGASLPVGILEHVVPVEYRARLSEGDMLVMCSDGVQDAFQGEKDALPVLLQRYLHCPPQRLAEAVLQDALLQAGGLPRDDMTVMCLQFTADRAEGRPAGDSARYA